MRMKLRVHVVGGGGAAVAAAVLLSDAGLTLVDGDGEVTVAVGWPHDVPAVSPVVCVAEDRETLVAALIDGVPGVIPGRAIDRLPDVVSIVVGGLRVVPQLGGPPDEGGLLSAEETDVFRHLAQGSTELEIAEDWGYSRRQVQRRVSGLLRGLGVGSRREALLVAGAVGVGWG